MIVIPRDLILIQSRREMPVKLRDEFWVEGDTLDGACIDPH